MATINFNSTITKVNSATLTLDNSTYIGVAIKTSHNDHLINTKTSTNYTLPNAYTYAGLIYAGTKNYTITATTAFATATFADGVYTATINESYDDGNTYVSTAYQLFTYVIDARWALFLSIYNPDNPSNLATYNTVSAAYATITTLQSNLAANYSAINAQIVIIENALATIIVTFDSTATLTSATTITVSTDFTAPTMLEGSLMITNTLTTNNKNYDPYPQLNIANSGTKTKAFVSGSPLGSPNFEDGIYSVSLSFDDTDSVTCDSTTNSILVTTAIDAAIASYPTDSLFNMSNKALMLYFRGLIDTAFADEDYATCGDYIVVVQNLLFVTPSTFVTSLILEANNSFQSVSSVVTTTGLIWQYNLLWNTKTQDVEDAIVIENNYLLPDGNGSASFTSADTFDSVIYADGVYQLWNYLADITGGVLSSDGSNNSGWRIVTTTIDAEFATFEANYDPNNAEQAASYAAMLAAYAEIQTLSSSINTNYADINDQIAIIQANLALWVELDMSLVLTNKSLMTLTINTTLPNVVYSAQSLNLSNTNDDSQEYIVTTFPENYIDLTKTFSSSEINFGTQFDDGVYKLNLSWSAENSMEFSGVTYCLVMTQVDCGIAQVVANRPNCKNVRSQLNMLMLFRDMALDAYSNEDYTTCNFYINKCIIILNQSGCGCGCN